MQQPTLLLLCPRRRLFDDIPNADGIVRARGEEKVTVWRERKRVHAIGVGTQRLPYACDSAADF